MKKPVSLEEMDAKGSTVDKPTITIKEEPSVMDPSVEEPCIEEPFVEEPSVEELSIIDPSLKGPSGYLPSVEEPLMDKIGGPYSNQEVFMLLYLSKHSYHCNYPYRVS